jgi:hypothetical protein
MEYLQNFNNSLLDRDLTFIWPEVRVSDGSGTPQRVQRCEEYSGQHGPEGHANMLILIKYLN